MNTSQHNLLTPFVQHLWMLCSSKQGRTSHGSYCTVLLVSTWLCWNVSTTGISLGFWSYAHTKCYGTCKTWRNSPCWVCLGSVSLNPTHKVWEKIFLCVFRKWAHCWVPLCDASSSAIVTADTFSIVFTGFKSLESLMGHLTILQRMNCKYSIMKAAFLLFTTPFGYDLNWKLIGRIIQLQAFLSQ